MNSITLYFTQSQHDKFWRVWRDAAGQTFTAWGRRGTAGGTAINSRDLEILVYEKMRKGYTADVSGVPHSGPGAADVLAAAQHLEAA